MISGKGRPFVFEAGERERRLTTSCASETLTTEFLFARNPRPFPDGLSRKESPVKGLDNDATQEESRHCIEASL